MLKKLIREDFKLSRPRQDHSIPFAFQIIGKYYSTTRESPHAIMKKEYSQKKKR